MRRIVTAGVLAGATAAVVVSGTLASYASWFVPDAAPTAKAQAPSMPAGPTATSDKAAGDAVVTWDAQQIAPGVRITAYVVTAHDTDQSPLPPIAHIVAASAPGRQSVTFTGAELAGGKWKWAITPKLESWTGTEGALSNPKLVFEKAPPRAVAAGTRTSTIPDAAPVEPAPAPAPTTRAVTGAPAAGPTPPAGDPTPRAADPTTSRVDPTTPAADKDPVPGKSESADIVDPSPAESAE